MVSKWVCPTSLLPSSLQFAQATPSSVGFSNRECRGHRFCHTVVSTAPAVKWMYGQHCWILKLVKVQALASLKTCWGNPGLYLKKDTFAHTDAHTHSGTHSVILEGPLCASLSFPPTHSSLLTLTVAVTTRILFGWIFQALQSSRCCYIYSA